MPNHLVMSTSPPPGDAQAAPHGLQASLPVAVASVTAAIAVLGVLKTLFETSSGMSFSVSDVAYYVGMAAVGVYLAVWPAGLLAGGVAWLGENVFKADVDDLIAVIFIGGTLLGAIIAPFQAGAPGTDGTADVLRIVGIATVALGCFIYFKVTKQLGS